MAKETVECYTAQASREEKAKLSAEVRAKAQQMAQRTEAKRLEARRRVYELRRMRTAWR